MGGKSNGGAAARYGCYGDKERHGLEPCGRRISADPLESFVADAAIALLEQLTVTGGESAAMPLAEDHAAIEADRAEIAELKDMWDRQEIRTAEYRQMR